MAEEQEESTGKSFKGILIGLASTITLGVGGFITNKLTGGGDDDKAPVQQAAPVINIQNTQNTQQKEAKTSKKKTDCCLAWRHCCQTPSNSWR